MRVPTDGILRKVESFLYGRGFSAPSARRILAVQILLAGMALAVGLACVTISLWPLAFAIGAVLITCNMWWLTRSVEWSLRHSYSSGLAALAAFSFVLRFGAMALALYGSLVWLALPVVPLLAGLSSVVASLSVQAVMRLSRNAAKEA